jgi:hypothetical protein
MDIPARRIWSTEMRNGYRVRSKEEAMIVTEVNRRRTSALLLGCLLLIGSRGAFAWQADPRDSLPPPRGAEFSQDQLDQLVAPIALYPDALIAQILAAATFPEQILEAGTWMGQHKDLPPESVAQEVDRQPWDPSVKALTQFPPVLANMKQNLAWTSELGDVYANQQQDVSKAIQTMRGLAKRAENLNTNAQQKVSEKGRDIVIEPAEPDVIYVPQYDPWLAYGYPLAAFPGWYPYPGLYFDGPGINFGIGFGLGVFSNYGWGFRHWGYRWNHGGRVYFNHHHYRSRSLSIVNRNDVHAGRANAIPGGRGPGGRGPRGGGRLDGHPGPRSAEPSHPRGTGHSGAFGGFNHGGITRDNAARGRASLGGSHGGGGGGMRGGGHGGGGGRR